MVRRDVPNLVFLYTDEQRFDALGAYGNDRIETPHIDALAASSHVVERAYVTQAVCTPSRASLMTGLFPHQHGLVNNNIALEPNTRCFPELLAASGVRDYRSAHFGKWHLGDEIYAQHGFDEWASTEDTYYHFYGDARDAEHDRSTYHRWLVENGVQPVNWVSGVPGLGENVEFRNRFTREQVSALPESLGRPAYLASVAGEFLERHRHTPFALFVNFLEPHMPFHGPRDNQYDPTDVCLPPDFVLGDFEGLSARNRLNAERFFEKGYEGHALNSEGAWRELVARYWGLCSQVDAAVGKIVQTLRALDLFDDTIIVFTSDHGDMMGGHALLAKACQYEGSARVPLTIKLPEQIDRVDHPGPFSQIDLVPTLLDLLGSDPNRCGVQLPGYSRASELKRGALEPADTYIEWNPPDAAEVWERPELSEVNPKREVIRSIVTRDLVKFNWSSRGDHELFDLNNDPAEHVNLLTSPSESSRRQVSECVDRLDAWQHATRDPARLPDPHGGSL